MAENIVGGQDHGALHNVGAKTDGEYADEVFKEHEKQINVTRKESYLSAANLLRVKEAKEGKEVDWDKLTPKQLAEILKSSETEGLTESEAKARFERDGPNELEKPKRPSLFTLFLIQLLNLIILLLVIAAFASLLVNVTGPRRDDWTSYTSPVAIFIIVFINAGIGAVTENSAAGALEALSKLSQPKATVIRDGKEQQIPSVKICKGDIVALQVGDIVPADLRLIVADDLAVNEMLLTGEPDDVNKFARMKKKTGGDGGHEKLTPENMAFSSCMCTNGKCKAFVVEIGMNTRVGKIAKLLADSDNKEEKGPDGKPLPAGQQKKAKKKTGPCGLPDTKADQTPLQASINELGVTIGVFAIIGCVILFIIGAARGVYNINYPLENDTADVLIYMVLISVTLAVAAIPEGIPLCVTISLSTGCSDMVKENVLVRRIAAVETLGCASVICTDKTGTLTEGKMTMVKMWASGQDYNVSGKGFDPTVGKITLKGTSDNAVEDVSVISALSSAVMCSDTKVTQETDPDDGTTKWVPQGNSSEAPIVVAAAKVGRYSHDLEANMPRVFQVPFSSARKMMLTVSELNDSKGSNAYAKTTFPGIFKSANPTHVANVKGAPNFILKDCDSWTTPSGDVVPLSQEDKDKVLQRVDELSAEALRVLAIAIRPIEKMPFDPKDKDLDWSTDQKFESLVKQPGLILLGLVASIDPERDGVPQAVLDAQGGHIRVVMITGDYLPTAKAIAHNVNILLSDDDEEACALDCGKLRPTGDYIAEEEIDHLTKTVKVFARAQPEDKLQIVKSLQRQGLVSAMTGDGVNDAPALKKADIGVAMGIQGTEVAKGASDMVLTDDNFCSIVKAVEKGRIIYAGIQKFIAFIMSVHVAEVAQIFLCIVANIPVMRTPLQILFMILVTDLPPSIALGMEKVARDILKDRPRPKGQPVLLLWQWQGVVMNAVILTISTTTVYLWALDYYLDSTFTVPDIANLFCGGDCDNAVEEELEDGQIEKLAYARTTAFISLVYSENIRAYTSRSFTEPVWVDMWSNTSMQKAILFAQIALYCAVFIPGLSDQILELYGAEIGGEGWLAAILGGIGTVVLCELYKFGTKGMVAVAEKKVADKLEREELARQKLADDRRLALKKAKTEAPTKA
eukprot:snap_masked-scaffold_16-processed-gene-2.28-mRNA-1 protein AED:0.01 eAED:0.02 QI:0/0/0/1/1/1/2/0/1138